MSEYPEYANPNALVSTEWVSQRLADSSVKLVEVDVDTSAYYEEGHIQGAVAWNWNTDLQDPVRRDILSREQMQELLRRSGIRNDDTIVLYGDNNNWFAAYAYWQLKLYGHKDVRLMNGGRKKWIAEGRPLVQEVPQPEPSDYVVQEVHPELRALQPFVLESIGKRPLVDVRSPQEYNGEILAPPGMSETAQRAGHIPTAINVPWSKTVNEDGTFKSRDELARLYQEAGLSPDAESIITYCRIGERSSHTWFVLKELLGYPDVRNYDGSWTEWGSMVGTPIENPAAS
ncbi:MAG: sulfurtransferase [Clostridia bacterium]|nr:sulfurtransferase [Bacillota bacterium]MBO2521966.1 sulfurtransferase [Bacillota bacterium]